MSICRVATKKQLIQEISSLIDEHVNYVLNKKPEYDFIVQNSNTLEVLENSSNNPSTNPSTNPNPSTNNQSNPTSKTTSKTSTTKEKTKKKAKTEDITEDVSEDICLAMLTNGGRCTRQKDPTGKNDKDLCKFHNNDKFIGRIEKAKTNTTNSESTNDNEYKSLNDNEEKSLNDNEDNDKSNNEDIQKNGINVESDDYAVSNNESAEDVQQIFLKKDEDDDLIDQDGNIWQLINDNGEEEEKIIGKKDLETNQKHFFNSL